MVRLSKRTNLIVALNGIEVGVLTKASNGEVSFRYDNNWLSEGFQISLSLPLQEDTYKGEIVSRYFDNFLPDNDEIKNKVATKFGAESTSAFDMLNVIGKDCVGALSFVHEGDDLGDNYKLDYKELSNKEIAHKLRGLSSVSPLGMEEDKFRISLAGAQEKTALLRMNGKWCEPHGLTPTTHIFKTPIGALGVGLNFEDSIDNEYISLKIMEKLGLDVCEAKIASFEDQRVLVVERFDRRFRKVNGKDILIRIPQEDMCQATGISSHQKYESHGGPGIIQIAKILNASSNLEDKLRFFKSIIAFDLIVATDGHAKNFSIFHGPSGFKLTPLYDVMSGYFFHARENIAYQKLKLAMNVGNSGHYDFKRISKRHYFETAKKCGISEENCTLILDELKHAITNLSFTKKELDKSFNHGTLDCIMEGIEKRKKRVF